MDESRTSSYNGDESQVESGSRENGISHPYLGKLRLIRNSGSVEPLLEDEITIPVIGCNSFFAFSGEEFPVRFSPRLNAVMNDLRVRAANNNITYPRDIFGIKRRRHGDPYAGTIARVLYANDDAYIAKSLGRFQLLSFETRAMNDTSLRICKVKVVRDEINHSAFESQLSIKRDDPLFWFSPIPYFSLKMLNPFQLMLKACELMENNEAWRPMVKNSRRETFHYIRKFFWSDANIERKLRPSDFSLWLASCLPISDETREELFLMTSVVERLRKGIEILEDMDSSSLLCKNCFTEVANTKDMAVIGSAKSAVEIYTNPNGAIFRTITLSSIKNIIVDRDSSIEQDSWFPGFKWSYASCRTCYSHLGWYFAPSRSLQGQRTDVFWSLILTGLIEHSRPITDRIYYGEDRNL